MLQGFHDDLLFDIWFHQLCFRRSRSFMIIASFFVASFCEWELAMLWYQVWDGPATPHDENHRERGWAWGYPHLWKTWNLFVDGPEVHETSWYHGHPKFRPKRTISHIFTLHLLCLYMTAGDRPSKKCQSTHRSGWAGAISRTSIWEVCWKVSLQRSRGRLKTCWSLGNGNSNIYIYIYLHTLLI